MRVVVMDTGRGIDSDKVAMWRSHLALADTDELSLVAWQAPKEQLPVSTHLVCGPVLRLGREAQDWPVQRVAPPQLPDAGGTTGEPAAPATITAAALGDATEWGVDEAVSGTRGGLGTAELDEQLTEHAAEPGQAAAADEPAGAADDIDDDLEDATEDEAIADLAEEAANAVVDVLAGDGAEADGVEAPLRATQTGSAEAGGEHAGTTSSDVAAQPGSPSLAHLPVYDPRRVRQAVRWRTRRVRRRASRFTSRQVKRVRKTGSEALHLPSSVVSSALRARSDGIAGEFAVAVMSSRKVAELFREADVVVPVDQRSQKAAWLLARRHQGPDVVVTLPAAARAVTARRHREGG